MYSKRLKIVPQNFVLREQESTQTKGRGEEKYNLSILIQYNGSLSALD
jgi:hypothetical protein